MVQIGRIFPIRLYHACSVIKRIVVWLGVDPAYEGFDTDIHAMRSGPGFEAFYVCNKRFCERYSGVVQ